MPYNLTALANATDLLSIAQNTSSILFQDMLGNLFLFIIFVIATMAFYQSNGDIGKAITGSAFITFILSIILLTVSLASPVAVYLSLIITAGALAFTWRSS